MTLRPLKIAIVGCGKIADQHVEAVDRVPGASILAICDREPLMARQLAERFGISGVYSDVHELLEVAKPDVVHITTPPQSHFALARTCLEAGAHVYLEKPFTINAAEAEALVQLAQSRQLKLTAGHNLQFTPEMLRMREQVRKGFLSGKPVHVESCFSYSLDDTSYIGPLLGNRTHWVRQLPGQLFHNLISHGIARLVEFLDNEPVEVVADAHQSARLHALGGEEVLDELRVMLRDASGTTGFFCFSTQVKGLNELRVYGPEGSVTADVITGSVISRQSRSYKSYLTYFVPPTKIAWQHLRNARVNVANFLRRKLYQDFGMTELIRRFYNQIRQDGAPPISYREIVLTARIMDEIFAQIYSSERRAPKRQEIGRSTPNHARLITIP